MNHIDELIAQAKESCKNRCHDMEEFLFLTDSNETKQKAISRCKRCSKYVMVETHPALNSIDIGGPAVGLNCTHTLHRPGSIITAEEWEEYKFEYGGIDRNR